MAQPQNQGSKEEEKIDENMFTCAICYEEYDLGAEGDEKVELKMLDACKHTFCGDCFSQFFASLIEDQNRSHDMRCP